MKQSSSGRKEVVEENVELRDVWKRGAREKQTGANLSFIPPESCVTDNFPLRYSLGVKQVTAM